ncbi:MAG: GTPase domain-containing protein, partial [Gemmataceae bacterium]
MTTWAAERYVRRLLEVAALADVIVYVASDERYNDEVPTDFLQWLLRAGKPVVAVLTKMPAPQAAALSNHFRAEVLAKIAPGVNIPVVAFSQLTPAERNDPAGAGSAHRAALLNPLLAFLVDRSSTRERTERNAFQYLRVASEGLLEVAREELQSLEAWRGWVQDGQQQFLVRYREEYLRGEPFRRFDRTREQILQLLELPPSARYLSAMFHLLRLPYFYLRELVGRMVTRPPVPNLPEKNVLDTSLRAWLDGLQAAVLRQAHQQLFWKPLATEFEPQFRPAADKRFQELLRGFESKETDELETAARELPERLQNNSGLLSGLRFGKVILDVVLVVFLVYWTWVPEWYHALLILLVVSFTHQVTEWL